MPVAAKFGHYRLHPIAGSFVWLVAARSGYTAKDWTFFYFVFVRSNLAAVGWVQLLRFGASLAGSG